MNYISKKEAVKLFNKCMNELYIHSEPSIKWKEVQEKYSESKEAFYLNYRIDEESYNKIVDKYKKLIPKLYHNDLDWYLLDYAPTTINIVLKNA